MCPHTQGGCYACPTTGYWRQARSAWPLLSYYQRFEATVALVLTVVIGLILLVALYRLTYGVLSGLLRGDPGPVGPTRIPERLRRDHDPAYRAGVQPHTPIRHSRRSKFVQTKVVLLIALLAVARKFIVLDLMEKVWAPIRARGHHGRARRRLLADARARRSTSETTAVVRKSVALIAHERRPPAQAPNDHAPPRCNSFLVAGSPSLHRVSHDGTAGSLLIALSLNRRRSVRARHLAQNSKPNS